MQDSTTNLAPHRVQRGESADSSATSPQTTGEARAMLRFLTAAGAFAAFIGMLFGAFGTHALRARIPADRLAIYETGVRYHLLHALALVLVAILSERLTSVKLVRWTGNLMIAGIVIFSGSLYALAISGVRLLGAITPIGGFCFLIAWLLLGLAALRQPAA